MVISAQLAQNFYGMTIVFRFSYNLSVDGDDCVRTDDKSTIESPANGLRLL